MRVYVERGTAEEDGNILLLIPNTWLSDHGDDYKRACLDLPNMRELAGKLRAAIDVLELSEDEVNP